ncbi:hypothetical protein HTSR_0752 [Halodesulfurarchaeum formicicum]|uniref:Uncharacterized protein n=1 Tax=Halodesulfurarchaeum formicicum TaxID=1873524 RepID=A0A1D8S3K5_9EURY|nr:MULTISPECIES: hypothetical protein [Halodesulfurarchaeum]AOW79942.1 hypothetical protein HTSR_0752 [Halodesulfurarchaeum formicicum]MDR5657481.1 hypothetical protein [Halodesulfurarchaeum sp. HSR-GB]
MELTQPSNTIKERAQAEVSHDDHLVGYELHGMAGNKEVQLHTLEEVASFIHTADVEELSYVVGSGGTVGYVDLEILEGWVRDVIRDAELADEIGKIREANDSYADCVEPISTLIGERLEQARED